jgi:N6-L-threonylcarbamoyladenine synthase
VERQPIILGIESSCDETSFALLQGNKILAHKTARQEIHSEYGGVVPELASRAHMQNIIPTLQLTLRQSAIELTDINAIAYTRGPGLLGSLLVGSSLAKGLSLALNKPLVAVNHMKGHILAHFIDDNASIPDFPFICLTVSGGHTQLVIVRSPLEMEVVGKTLDDAAGEAFDKTAKMLDLPYPGGPLIDQYAKEGNPDRFSFRVSKLSGFDYTFSGIKTGVLYFLKEQTEKNPNFIIENLADICASAQATILDMLFHQLEKLVEDTGITEVAIAGGVSANSDLRKRLQQKGESGWKVHIPKFEYCTDNAAMIAMAGKFLYEAGKYGKLCEAPAPRMSF